MADLLLSFGLSHSRTIGHNSNPSVPLVLGKSLRSEAVNIGASSVRSTLTAEDEDVVFLSPDADCYVAISNQNPTAQKITSTGTKTGSSIRLKAGIDYQFSVSKGDQVAVIQA